LACHHRYRRVESDGGGVKKQLWENIKRNTHVNNSSVIIIIVVVVVVVVVTW